MTVYIGQNNTNYRYFKTKIGDKVMEILTYFSFNSVFRTKSPCDNVAILFFLCWLNLFVEFEKRWDMNSSHDCSEQCCVRYPGAAWLQWYLCVVTRVRPQGHYIPVSVARPGQEVADNIAPCCERELLRNLEPGLRLEQARAG